MEERRDWGSRCPVFVRHSATGGHGRPRFFGMPFLMVDTFWRVLRAFLVVDTFSRAVPAFQIVDKLWRALRVCLIVPHGLGAMRVSNSG